MLNYWRLYDQLIETADADDVLKELIVGESWTMIRTESGRIGAAATQAGTLPDQQCYVGKRLSELAPLIKSWNLCEAALGLCAINACLNQAKRFPPQENPDAFLRYRDRIAGKQVAVVGHFAYLEERIQGLCELSVLERNPHGNDLPDPACEYILPEMDVVFITGSAIPNKTMPRLLTLSRNAFTVITGPSTPMSPLLFDRGADALCGFCAAPEAWQAALLNRPLFACGTMVCLEKRSFCDSGIKP